MEAPIYTKFFIEHGPRKENRLKTHTEMTFDLYLSPAEILDVFAADEQKLDALAEAIQADIRTFHGLMEVAEGKKVA